MFKPLCSSSINWGLKQCAKVFNQQLGYFNHLPFFPTSKRSAVGCSKGAIHWIAVQLLYCGKNACKAVKLQICQ